MKKYLLIIGGAIVGVVALVITAGMLRSNPSSNDIKMVDNKPVNNQAAETANTNTTGTVETAPAKVENKLCDWVDKSDIIIKVNIPEGVIKDTSYEAGFYYSTIGSDMRLARAACDYRTGFSYEEMKGKGAVQVGVRGYSDSRRRQIVNEPVSLNFDALGKPDIGSYIEVTIKD